MTEQNTEANLSEDEREAMLSTVAHDLRNIASTIRAEAQLAQMKYERSGNVERMRDALASIITQTDLLVQVLEKKLDKCRRRRRPTL